jgi:hypothetical protein
MGVELEAINPPVISPPWPAPGDHRENVYVTEGRAPPDPGLEYIHRVGSACEAGLEEIDRALIAAYRRLNDDPDALSLEGMGISRPSSTWIYQVDDASRVRFNLARMAG